MHYGNEKLVNYANFWENLKSGDTWDMPNNNLHYKLIQKGIPRRIDAEKMVELIGNYNGVTPQVWLDGKRKFAVVTFRELHPDTKRFEKMMQIASGV